MEEERIELSTKERERLKVLHEIHMPGTASLHAHHCAECGSRGAKVPADREGTERIEGGSCIRLFFGFR
jgi:hypothetical protein